MKHIAAMLLTGVVATAAFAQSGGHDHASMTHEHANMNHDAMFADMMIKHHRGGIQMARLAVDKAGSAELRAMAQQMIDDQTREIDQLQTLRGDAPAMTMSETMEMPGMMSAERMQKDMARLEGARGREFDLAFTEIMAGHHDGAIELSKHELAMGSNQALRDIAQKISDKQARERQQLLVMHDSLMEAQPMTSSARETTEPRTRMRKN